jgi:hypothetical protein
MSITMGAEKTSIAKLPAHLLRRISVDAGVDPRTVRRVVSGKPTKGLQRERVERALTLAGLANFLPAVCP